MTHLPPHDSPAAAAVPSRLARVALTARALWTAFPALWTYVPSGGRLSTSSLALSDPLGVTDAQPRIDRRDRDEPALADLDRVLPPRRTLLGHQRARHAERGVTDISVASGVTGQCANSGTALASGSELDVAIPTSVVPSGAQAVVLNVTAIGASASGFLSTYAATGAAPTSYISNVNFAAGQDVANSVTVADNAGAVDVYFGPSSPSASVNVAVDVEGYYMTPSSTSGDPFTAITPTRVADTRCGTSQGQRRIGNPKDCPTTQQRG